MFTAAVVTIARTWKQPKYPSIDEWIRCGIYIRVYTPHTPHTHTHTHTYTHNGILLSNKKEWNSFICNDVDGSRICHTEWGKSEREKIKCCILIRICNLEKWYRWTYMQGRDRVPEVGTNLETSTEIYTASWVKQASSGKVLSSPGSSAQGFVMA